MGSARRPKPERLAEKLLQIRLALGLSQDGMLRSLGLDEVYLRSRISAYELGNREPHLPVLLKYARLVGISTDVLIDDELNLPAKLLKASEQGAVRSKSPSRSRRKQ
jgi:transcriptional regulator with XRE-family HTH domain